MLVVDILNDALEIKTSSIAHKRAIEASGDAKDGLEDLVDLLLVGVVLIGKVVKSAGRNIDSAVPHGSSNITHVNGAETEIAGPHELHLLLQVLVNGSADETGGNAAHVTRAVHGGRTKDDKRKASDTLKITLGLKVSLGEHGPGVDLVTLLGRLLASRVDLGSAQVHELLDARVLDSLSGDLHADVMELLLVDRLVLTILGLSCAVEDVVEILAIVTSEALGDGSSAGKVTLDELHDGVGEKSSVGSVEESGLREDLIDAADLCDSAGADEVLAEVTANEASATKNKNGCHF